MKNVAVMLFLIRASIIIYGKGYGNDVITDNNGKNRIKLVGLKPEDMYVRYTVGNKEAILTIAETGETLTISSFNNGYYRNFTLEFDDGTEMAIDAEGSPFLNGNRRRR